MLRRALLLAGAVRPRLVERPLWRLRHRHGYALPTDEAFVARFRYDGDFLTEFRARHARRFGLHPGTRVELLAAIRGAEIPLDGAVAAADRILRHEVDLLGSGPVSLGQRIDWHRDFKSGRRWAPELFWRIDYTNLDEPSDVKLPWELSRFHWAVWLGEAYWATGDERYAEGFHRLAGDWLDANPVAYGVNWAVPMELSIRAANWALAIGFFGGSPAIPVGFWLRFLKVLEAHGDVIRHNLEYERLLGNHYISNGCGLALLGLLFRDTPRGRRWLEKGRSLLEREMRRQVHPDGVSYEKSISYHRLVLELFTTAALFCRRDGVEFSPRFHERLRRMFDFVEAYTRPDGSAPLVSDADDGRVFRFSPDEAPTDHRHALQTGTLLYPVAAWKAAAGAPRAELAWLGGTEGLAAYTALSVPAEPPRSRAFPAGGYYVFRDPGTHTFLDAGEIGFWGQAVHGHNDTLSFELYAPGGVFLTDSGTYLYTSDPAAHRAHASTRAHNTVMVDGEEVAEFAGLWQIAADVTRPRVLEWSVSPGRDRWTAEHYGYTRLASPVVHRRTVELEKAARAWTITDELLGGGRHEAELNFHLHPDAEVARISETQVAVTLGEGTLRITFGAPVAETDGWVASRYGVRRRGVVLRVVLVAELPVRLVTSIMWQASVRRVRSGEDS